MEPKKKHKSHVKIVIYFKRKADGTPYTPEEKSKSFNRKQEYKFDYFPKRGGGWITDHEKAFDNADKHLKQVISLDNLDKGIIFIITKQGLEERVVNYVDGKGWEFYHRPSFVTTAAGHRYFSQYQSLNVFEKIKVA